MGGGSDNRKSSSSSKYSWAGGGTNANFDPDRLNNMMGRDITRAYQAGPAKQYGKSLYTGLGDTTQEGMQGLLDAAQGSNYGGYISGAMDSLGATARGDNLGVEAPGYQAVRDNLQSDVLAGVGSQFASSGRFGGGSHVNQATRQLTSSLGALDMDQYNRGLDRQVQAASMLPGLYQASLAPSQTVLGVGQAMDQDAQARRLADYELFQRTNDPAYQHIAKYQGLLGGNVSTQGGIPQEPQKPGLLDWIGTIGTIGVGLM